ncbi:hypothetical protein [Marinomonas spartinae]|uniref:hypothetical protein n=1 Tax=Marinomonas spartinae TaxID=1792290 RepID=UPI0018F124D7|nr:hypothetical protein [Marinomonas spartinae]MBJ7555469.1 hypothetical protein [Marinomonas spartinae]
MAVKVVVITKHFDKRHDNILRKIESLECSDEYRALNFEVMAKRGTKCVVVVSVVV